MSDQEESVGARKKCWNCGWIIIESQINSIWNHSCFANYNEKKHAIIIQEDGTISMVALSAKKRKLAEEIRLINEIRKRPALFDKNLKFKTSFEERDHLWVEAASAISPDFPANEAKRNWRNLRDQFKKAISSENAVPFRHYERMLFLEECQSSNINEKSVLREVSQNVMGKRTSLQGAGSGMREVGEERLLDEALMDRLNEENQIRNPNRRWTFDSPSVVEPLSTAGTATHLVSAENVNSRGINTRRGRASDSCSAAEPISSPDTAANSVTAESMNRQRINSRPKHNKEALQMLVLEKIRSHKVEKSDPTDMFLLSLGETYKKLDHARQLRVHRRFIEILEEEFNEQEYRRTQRDDT